MLNVRHAVMLVLLAGVVAATLAWYLSTASAGPPAPILVNFTLPHQHPVAGQLFEGLAIVNRSTWGTLSSIKCDAEVAGKTLPARKQTFFTPNKTRKQVVICSWQIPAGTDGKPLRFSGNEHRAHVNVGGMNYGSPEFSWIVKRT
jgi:hypothetical protein